MRKYVAILAIAVLALSCGPRGGKQQKAPATRAFPRVEAPVMVGQGEERLEYIVLHFWDAFTKDDYPSDSLIIKVKRLGVTYLADHDHVRIMPQDRPQGLREDVLDFSL